MESYNDAIKHALESRNFRMSTYILSMYKDQIDDTIIRKYLKNELEKSKKDHLKRAIKRVIFNLAICVALNK